MTKASKQMVKWRIKNKMTNESEGFPKHASPQLKALIKEKQ